MRKPLNVTFLLEDLCFGGTQKQNLELASRLDRKRFQPQIISLSGPGDFDPFIKKSGLPVIHMGKDRGAAPLFFARLGQFLKKATPDILVPCTALPNIWGRIWGKLLKIPVIVGTCRGGGAINRQHERFLWRLADHLVCNSLPLQEQLASLGIPAGKIAYIPNGVDTDWFVPKESDQNLILCVARLARDKDHPTLLKAFEKVLEKVPDARLRLVGDGAELAHIQKFIAEELNDAARDRIELAGSSANPLEHYQDASIFALASLREGQPNVILEAMSCGLPVCSTNVGGIPQLVANGGTGFLSHPQNSAELADNIVRLLQNRKLARDFGAKGREFVQDNFSFAKMTASHQELFERLWDRYEKN